MKNKDLFEAIDNIDEKYVNDAGKYLGGYLDTDPVEVRPASKKLTPFKIAAPIAAALAVVCGITLVARTQRPTMYSPGAAIDSEDTSSDIVDGNETSGTSDTDETSDIESTPETSTPPMSEMDEHLYSYFDNYTLIGPDGKQITFSDGSGGFLDMDPPPTGIVKYGFEGTYIGFAFIAKPTGANYNSADNPEAFTEDFVFNGSTDFKRVYDARHPGFTDKTGKIGNFTVETAYGQYIWASEDSDELVYKGSDLCINGTELLEDVYLVKSGNEYYCIARNGETHLPSLNIKQQNDGSYALAPYRGNISGLEYMTETPPILVNVNRWNGMLDWAFAENSYIKARVLISNIQYFEVLGNDITAYIPEIISLQRGSAEPKEVAAAINSEASRTELKTALMERFGFTDVRVFEQFTGYDGNGNINGIELTDKKLVLGMKVAVYDENGLCGIYTYGDVK